VSEFGICIYSVAESSLIPVRIFLLTRKDKIGIAELYKPVKIKLRYLTSTISQWADLTDLETLRSRSSSWTFRL
jgi:hypothetical protein